ncbi:pentatricopeptide repeat-containing protein, partial [Trifolium medium]|nr:pentatricopeptide repeat-containing protein [Trifolium medium]
SLRLYDQMKKREWIPGIEIYNSLVYVLTRENCPKEALKTIDKMKEQGLQPDSDTFNSMIRPLCQAGKLAAARIVLNTMVEENISPTVETYHAFFEGTDYHGTLEFLKMKKYDVEPSCIHYRKMVGGLVTCRWFIKAKDFYEEMISNGCSEDPKLNKLLQKEVLDSGDKRKQNVKKAISDKV